MKQRSTDYYVKLIEKLDMTDAEIARALGCSRNTIHYIHTGKTLNPRSDISWGLEQLLHANRRKRTKTRRAKARAGKA